MGHSCERPPAREHASISYLPQLAVHHWSCTDTAHILALSHSQRPAAQEQAWMVYLHQLAMHQQTHTDSRVCIWLQWSTARTVSYACRSQS